MALAAALASCAVADLPPAPTPHLTPPPAADNTAPRQDSAVSSSEEFRSKGRSIDSCSPCDRVPWVPMARSLVLDQHYALSVPAVPLSLPVSYGIPVTRLKLTPNHQAPPDVQYGPPTADDSRDTIAERPQEDDQSGLPPPPLPQPIYGAPHSSGPTQHVSESNVNPSSQQFVPPPPPAYLNYQLLPSVKFGPPFHSKPPAGTSIPKPSMNYVPQNPLKSPANNYLLQNSPKPPLNPPQKFSKPPTSYLPQNLPSNKGRLVNQEPTHQYQAGSLQSPYFFQNPIPFPTMSKTLIPPLFNYQTFHDGKRTQLHPYLQPPKPQNVVVTITESEDTCKKCQDQKQSTDSEPAQAEHLTEHLVSTTEKLETTKEPPVESPKQNIQVVKSVPLAEYLASVEYPMQIVQAPILDVPDLTKYFNLGYHNFPQAPPHQGNGLHKLHDQNPAQTFTLPNKQNAENYNYNYSFSVGPSQQSSSSNLDDVSLPEEQTTNNLPPNHKDNIQTLDNHKKTTENDFASSTFSHTTDTSFKETTHPSQIYHISKVPHSSQSASSTSTTALPQLHEVSSTGGHFVTSQPLSEQQLPNTAKPAPFHEPVHSPSHAQSLTTGPAGEKVPTGPVNVRPPPPPSSGSLGDWALHPYGRGWGNPLPHPFEMPNNSPHRARFEVRPSPAPSKKAKHIHQIIVPYTTNKNKPVVVAQEPTNTVWTPIPPTNQGRKVPDNINIGSFPSSTGFDQNYNYQNIGPTGNSQVSTNVPLSASGSDSVPSQHILPPNNNQNYLPPHVINQILHNPAGAVWPTGSEGLQQLLNTNLQSLLRGEEDSIDIASLQKNIDKWTAEGYQQNSPSVNYIPATTISHIYNSKKIPNEYLTSTEPAASSSQPERDNHSGLHNYGRDDNEGAASLRHQVKIEPDPHAKDQESKTEAVTETTSKVWENVQVSISPLTKEKVYVVTPVPITDTTPSTSQA